MRAFGELGLPLIVVGDGPAARRLRRIAAPNVRFTGRIGDAEAARLMATCRAFVVTATEEFGIAAVEAQAAGRPGDRPPGRRRARDRRGRPHRPPLGGRARRPRGRRARRSTPTPSIPQECVRNARRFSAETFRAAFPREVAKAIDEAPAERGEEERRGAATAHAALGPRVRGT